jgi:hypothetical protein
MNAGRRSRRHRGQHPQAGALLCRAGWRSRVCPRLAAAQHASSSDPFYKRCFCYLLAAAACLSFTHLFTLTLAHSGNCGASLASLIAAACTALVQLHFCNQRTEGRKFYTSFYTQAGGRISWMVHLAGNCNYSACQLLQNHCTFFLLQEVEYKLLSLGFSTISAFVVFVQ